MSTSHALLAQGSAQATTNDGVSLISSALSASPAASAASSTGSFVTDTGTGEARVHLVTAGKGGWQFEPAELANVSIGDIITFEFYPPDHSVARADYGSACVPYEYTGKDRTGFWSETQWVKTASDVSDLFCFLHWCLLANGARSPTGI